MEKTKFSYVQIGARDPRALAAFYEKAIGFLPCSDTRWLNGREGICLAAPGFVPGTGPIFGFVPASEGETASINDAGFAHTCYETSDVKAAVTHFLRCGGTVHSTMAHPEKHPCVYCKDPEGNVVEFHIPFPSEKTAGAYLKTAGSLLGLKRERKLRRGDPSGAIKFIHVNLICPDWDALCGFYRDVFGCVDFGAGKDHQGDYKEKVIGVPGVHVVGRHVLLPGFKKDYPTLEIFTYSVPGRPLPCSEQELGINAIGFSCADPDAAAAAITAAGGFLNQKDENFLLAGDLQNGRILLRRG